MLQICYISKPGGIYEKLYRAYNRLVHAIAATRRKSVFAQGN